MNDFYDLTPPNIRDIEPYLPGKPISELAREMGLEEGSIIKMASNENPLGASPLVKQAIYRALPEIARYPDGNGFLLKQAISQHYNIDINQIVLGNGSNDVLDLIARTFLSPGMEAIYAQYAFAVYGLAAQSAGAKGVVVSACHYAHDLSAMYSAITDQTRLIFIANPNNPTGTWIESDELHPWIAELPRHVAVILDEAYDEYLPETQKSKSISWLDEFENLMIVRTFSKAYGLAGLRIGYLLTQPKLAEIINRVRQPFNVNGLAQIAAVAALQDQNHIVKSCELNRQGMQQLVTGLQKLKLDYIPSYANFVTFQTNDASAINLWLLQNGVIIRPLGNYQLPNHLRVSIGTSEENRRFLDMLEQKSYSSK